MGLLVLWHPRVSCCCSVLSFLCFAGLCCCFFTIPSPFGPDDFFFFFNFLCSSTFLHQPRSLLEFSVPSVKAYFEIQSDNRMPLFPGPLIVFHQKWIVLNLNTSPSVNGFPSLFLTASLCCCKVQQSFWWTQHVISEPCCTSALHTHTEHSWVLAVNLWSISRFNGMVFSVQQGVRLPEARNGIRNVVLVGWFSENPQKEKDWEAYWSYENYPERYGRVWNKRSSRKLIDMAEGRRQN